MEVLTAIVLGACATICYCCRCITNMWHDKQSKTKISCKHEEKK